MTLDELAKRLQQDYLRAGERRKVVSVHLFGIQHAQLLNGVSLKELVIRAGLPEPYHTELRKGINLAKFVQLK